MPRRRKKQAWKSTAAERLLELAGDPPSVEEAVQIVAKQLLRSVAHPPTDLDAVAKKLGLDLDTEEEALDDVLHDDGLLFFEAPKLSSTQKRYAQARQLGHALFASMKPRGIHRGIELEKLCDMLATELLLPMEAFHEALGESISIQKVLEISSYFDVSVRLAASRFAQLPYVSVFEADKEFITWGYGPVHAGLIDNLDEEFRAVVEGALEMHFEKPARFFSAKKPWFGSRCVEWARFNGKTLFLVRLPRREEGEADKSQDLRQSIASSMGLQIPLEEN